MILAFSAAATLWLAVINAASFALFGLDKERARTNGQRIPESTLLATALLGGWPGARLGQQRFRHKTRKQPFAGILAMIGALQFGVLVLAGLVAVFTPMGDHLGRILAEPLLATQAAPAQGAVAIHRGLN